MSANKEQQNIEDILKAAMHAPEPSQTFRHGLRSRIVARANDIANPPRTPQLFIRRYLLPATAATLLLTIILVVGPQNALAGIKRIFGYQPEIGIVEVDDNFRSLVPPPPLEQDGLTITFEKGTADNTNTNLVFTVEGFTPQEPEDQPAPSYCIESPRLQTKTQELPIEKGQSLDLWDTGYTYRYTFPALPANENEATLQIPCLLGIGSGPFLRDLKVSLLFSSEQNPPLTPVVEIKTTPEVAAETGGEESLSPAESPEVESGVEQEPTPIPGIAFEAVLDQVLQWNDGTLLKGHIAWTDDRLEEWGIIPNKIQIRDASGKELIFEESYQNRNEFTLGSDQFPWAYFVPGNNYELPLTITFREIRASLPSGERFTVDFGPNPEIGQVWELGTTIQLDADHQLELISAAMIEGMNNEQGYDFTLRPLTGGPRITEAMIVDSAGRSVGGGGGGGDDELTVSGTDADDQDSARPETFTSGLYFPEPVPSGLLELEVHLFTVSYQGTWEASTGK